MPKIKLEEEYLFKVSPRLLYNYIATPGGLSKWFADDVNVSGEEYVFIWDDEVQKANLVDKKKDIFVRFQWEHQIGSEEYFEFRIIQDELTKESSLVICDYVEAAEAEEIQRIWNAQISKLQTMLGL